MLKDVEWAANRAYRSGSHNEPFEFFLRGLCNSTRLDLLLGYFSSAAISLLACGFATFLYNGGRMRLVINHVLAANDKLAIADGLQGNVANGLLDLSNIQQMYRSLDAFGQHFFDCISWLIAEKRISIVIVKPKDRGGVVHYKAGVFYDEEDAVLFDGSCNFSASAFLENLERINAFLSWENSRSSKMISEQQLYFEEVFTGQSTDVEYLEVAEVEVAISRSSFGKTIHDLLINEKALLEQKEALIGKSWVKELINNVVERIESYDREPRFPFSQGPRSYQMQAYSNWVMNGYQGLFAMATGTGKTITALNCILEEYRLTGTYRFLVLVPTIALASQWREEIEVKFRYSHLISCSSQDKDWETAVRQFATDLRIGIESNFCIVATYATFRGNKFQAALNSFGAKINLLTLIADEAHTFGSVGLLKALPHAILRRIGLSATPERVYDELGAKRLCDFFNSQPLEHTFVYSMRKAIEDGVLSRYYYYPRFVTLEPVEMVAYREFTRKLAPFIDRNTGRYAESPIVDNLLIQRKGIIHKANRKEGCLIQIIQEIGKENFHYAFVYVPEGGSIDYEVEDIDPSSDEDLRIIDRFVRVLHERFGLRVRKFTGETADREQVLHQFEEGSLDALLAMKCLDEGVDIPKTKYAVFCSSTGNPRQFVQRRGRILRQAPGKEMAYIYDMVVIPPMDPTTDGELENSLERSIFQVELRRLLDFVALCENRAEVLLEIESYCGSLGFDIYDLINQQIEH